MNKPYAVYTQNYRLQGAELHSGGENDPLVYCRIDAEEQLSYDNRGNKLPYSLQISIFGQELDRDNYILEDKDISIRRFSQEICISVLVWANMDDYYAYEQSDKIWVNG